MGFFPQPFDSRVKIGDTQEKMIQDAFRFLLHRFVSHLEPPKHAGRNA
jgi:hypothetical protein